MYLKSLSILNFKNYAEAEIELDPKLNCLVGLNGSGKTNLLDAIYYLAFCKSFFNPSDSQNIMDDEAFFSIHGNFQNNREEKVNCSMKKGHKKVIRRNGKNYERFADHIGLIPLVMISPIDILLIIEGSDGRRKWIDGIISQFERPYLDHLIKYNKALAQRNSLLKMISSNGRSDLASLQLWDSHLMEHGNYLFERREEILKQVAIYFTEYYNVISEEQESCGIEYRSHLFDKETFENQLRKSTERDLRLQFTSVGIHRDELVMTISGKPIKKFASQGQQKSVLLALRLAQARLIHEKSGKRPLMLLDDIYDKLDSLRMKKLLELLNTNDFGQLFITDTNMGHMKDLMKQGDMTGKFFEVESGSIREVQSESRKEEILK